MAEAVMAEVNAARARGWRVEDLRAWFKREGVTPGAATAGTKGESIDDASYHALATISISGIPQWPFQPNRQAILDHLHWLTEPARCDFGDGLLEIALTIQRATRDTPASSA
jgi:hypothetical protein